MKNKSDNHFTRVRSDVGLQSRRESLRAFLYLLYQSPRVSKLCMVGVFLAIRRIFASSWNPYRTRKTSCFLLTNLSGKRQRLRLSGYFQPFSIWFLRRWGIVGVRELWTRICKKKKKNLVVFLLFLFFSNQYSRCPAEVIVDRIFFPFSVLGVQHISNCDCSICKFLYQDHNLKCTIHGNSNCGDLTLNSSLQFD